jgi:hypothetical protein
MAYVSPLSAQTLAAMRAFWDRGSAPVGPVPDVDAVSRALLKAVEQDESASKAMRETAAAVQALPLQEAPSYNELRSVEFHSGSSHIIRAAPYSYGVDHGNLVSVSEDNNSGKMFLNGLAGKIVSAPGDSAMGVSTIGLAITAADLGALAGLGVEVRVGVSVNWAAVWDLACAGWPTGGIGSDPWSQARGAFNLTVWGPAGFVTQNGEQDVFSQHYADAPGGDWSHVQRSDNGYIPLSATFWVPPGETRFVNVDCIVEVKTGYSSLWNLASASGIMQNVVNFFVLTPQ